MKLHLAMVCGALALLSASPVLCDTLVTQCVKASCVRLRCDDWRENCSRIGYLERTDGRYAAPQAHQVCNEFGDCHFALPSFPPLPPTQESPAVDRQAKPAVHSVKITY